MSEHESLLIELLTEMRDEIRTMREYMEKREASYQTKEEEKPKLRTKADIFNYETVCRRNASETK